GAVGALVRGDDLDAVPAVRDWLAQAHPRPSGIPEDPEVAEGVQAHVLAQLLRLRSYPFIEKKLKERQLNLHAWYYEVHRGAVRVHSPETDAFEAL
ncbi:carbonic anhydrase, partial [Streptomyces sp. NPDC006356]